MINNFQLKMNQIIQPLTPYQDLNTIQYTQQLFQSYWKTVNFGYRVTFYRILIGCSCLMIGFIQNVIQQAQRTTIAVQPSTNEQKLYLGLVIASQILWIAFWLQIRWSADATDIESHNNSLRRFCGAVYAINTIRSIGQIYYLHYLLIYLLFVVHISMGILLGIQFFRSMKIIKKFNEQISKMKKHKMYTVRQFLPVFVSPRAKIKSDEFIPLRSIKSENYSHQTVLYNRNH